MAKELAKQYDPKGTEDRIYQEWCDKGYFHTQIDRSKKPFTIVMPPPNVTGQLHMGHAMDETWQDILTRYKRMQGYAALWVPGTDHASIATEAKVVAAMREEGLTKEMLGRDGFLERAWAWKNTYGSRIVSQLKKLGCSCDWQRERFTMDEGCSDAVKEVFVRLYDKGLIYRGNRMVNWCPHCNTSISDAEVEYEEKDGSFWHLLYPVKETGEMLELATTRPETMLGDTAVAINGEDPRYTHLHGCHVILPLLNKEIPIVCDEHADMEKGTGVVKITPAHDPNDFEVGERHNLPRVRVFTYDGRMTGAADKAAADELFRTGKATAGEPEVLDCGKYAGMTTREARKAILADLEACGALKHGREVESAPLGGEIDTVGHLRPRVADIFLTVLVDIALTVVVEDEVADAGVLLPVIGTAGCLGACVVFVDLLLALEDAYGAVAIEFRHRAAVFGAVDAVGRNQRGSALFADLFDLVGVERCVEAHAVVEVVETLGPVDGDLMADVRHAAYVDGHCVRCSFVIVVDARSIGHYLPVEHIVGLAAVVVLSLIHI